MRVSGCQRIVRRSWACAHMTQTQFRFVGAWTGMILKNLKKSVMTHANGIGLLGLAMVANGLLSGAAWAVPTVEVVQSVPLETDLAVPGVRSTQTVWLEMIAGATKTIDIEQFYVSNQAGQSLEPVLKALQDASHRGVKIRLLVDAKFYGNNPADVDALAQTGAMSIKTIDFSSLGGIMHAKYMIVDQQISYSGSANFDWLALSHIHEIGLKFVDSGISSELKTVFEKDWSAGVTIGHGVQQVGCDRHPLPSKKPEGSSFSDSSDPALELLASPPAANPVGVDTTLDHVTALMASAQRSLKIQVYEYTTKESGSSWKVLDQAIRAAAARGVAVELMVDQVALKAGKPDLVALAGVHGVTVKKVVIPQWSGGPLQYARLIHSKYFVVDHTTAWVGSENWSKGYFLSSRNVGLITHSADAAATLEQIYDKLWSSAYASSM